MHGPDPSSETIPTGGGTPVACRDSWYCPGSVEYITSAMPESCPDYPAMGTVLLTRHLPRQSVCLVTTCTIDDAGCVKSGINASASGRLVTPTRHVLPDLTASTGLPQAANPATLVVPIDMAYPATSMCSETPAILVFSGGSGHPSSMQCSGHPEWRARSSH